MQKINRNTEDEILGALLGAAIMGAKAKQTEAQSQSETDKDLERAQKVRKMYDAFLAVGFTEEQATQFIAAILS